MTKEVMWSQFEVGSLTAGMDRENRPQILTSVSRARTRQWPHSGSADSRSSMTTETSRHTRRDDARHTATRSRP